MDASDDHLYDPAALEQAARDKTGLDDYGERGFEQRLSVLLADLSELPQNEQLRAAVSGHISSSLENRLRVVHDRVTQPRIAAEEIRSPLVVIGLPRSGTTFLHSLLAQDPQAGSPLQWEVSRPSPPPRASEYTTDPRIALSRSEMSSDPEFLKRHMQGAELPVECGLFLYYDFANFLGTFARWDVPNFLGLWRRPGYASYIWHRGFLQHLQSQNPRAYWVLKWPCHVLAIDELIATYPDVRIVFTHRPPSSTLPSAASLIAYVRGISGSAVEPHKIGASIAELWDEGLRKFIAAYDGLPGGSSRFFHVDYSDLVSRPLEVVDDIHAHFGSELGRHRRDAIASWLNDNGSDRHSQQHGRHEYTAADYGLDVADLDERFSYYTHFYTSRLTNQGAQRQSVS